MEYETNRILEISLAKIDRNKASRKQATANSTLRRNLLVSSVLKAIKPDALPGNDILMDYRETKIIDLDIDEANFEKEVSSIKNHLNRKSHSIDNVDVEWKPHGNNESSEFDIMENVDCQMKAINTKSTESCSDVNRNCQNCLEKDAAMFLETMNKSETDLRNSLSFKRPRDSDFDINHMPRPHKICRVVNNDSCDVDTQAVSCLETLFRDSFNEFRDQAPYERPLNFAPFPLVSVMAC